MTTTQTLDFFFHQTIVFGKLLIPGRLPKQKQKTTKIESKTNLQEDLEAALRCSLETDEYYTEVYIFASLF